ncbi:WD40-repeat-containing domain [Phytophthora cactorum]|nr:WD40-repeat-containing domain [Phytophthora cactorum]
MPRSIDDLLFGASSDEEDAGDYAGYSGSSDDDDSSDSESEYNVGSFAQQHSSANLALPSANTANTAQTFAAAENDDDDVQILSAAEAAAEVAAAARRALEDPNTSRKRKRPMVETKPEPTECTICCEDCTIVGRHRLVALKCGHLFGRKCIERWISEKRTCPNCSAIVRRTDICLLFSDHVAVVDNAGLEDMTNKFEEEKKKSSKLEKEMTGLKKQLQARAREATRLSAELARFKKAIADMQCKAAQERLSSDATFSYRSGVAPPAGVAVASVDVPPGQAASQATLSQILSQASNCLSEGQLHSQPPAVSTSHPPSELGNASFTAAIRKYKPIFGVPLLGARVFSIARSCRFLCVGDKIAQGSHGILMLSSQDPTLGIRLPVHSSDVRDISIHPSEKFVLTVAFDGKLAMTSLQDKKVALQIVLPPVGGKCGQIRLSKANCGRAGHREELFAPTTATSALDEAIQDPEGTEGLAAATFRGLSVWRDVADVANAGNGSVGAPPFLHVPSDQACFSLASNELHSHQVVVSSRSTPMKHSLFDLRTVGLGRLSPRMEVTGHKAPSVLSRSAMWSEADGTSVVASWSHDVEGVTMWNVATQHEVSGPKPTFLSVTSAAMPVVDIQHVVAQSSWSSGAALLGTMTARQLIDLPATKRPKKKTPRSSQSGFWGLKRALGRMSGSFKASISQKAFLSPTDVAELTAAAVAALPSTLSQANLALKKSTTSAHRTENGDIVHHHQATHRGGNATLVTSTTTTIHHMGGAGKSGRTGEWKLGGNGLDGSVGSGALAASPTFQGDLNQIDAGLNSEDADVQLEAAKKLRVLLSSERDLLIRQMLEKNWTPRLIKWLRLRDRPTLQVEALWALTNIAAGATDNTSVLLQNGVIPTLVSLLDSSNEEVGLMVSYRHVVSWFAEIWCTLGLARVGVGTIRMGPGKLGRRRSCDKGPRAERWCADSAGEQPEEDVMGPTVAASYLDLDYQQLHDTEILSHVCWAFSHLCDGPSTHIQAVVDSDVCFRLVELLSHSSWRVTKPALRAIGNIVCAEDDTTTPSTSLSVARASLRRLIAHSNREIQKEACWTLSNIAAGTVDQIQCVLDSGCIPSLMGLAASDATDAEVKSEACWVVLNATSCGSDSQIEYLVNQGCIQILGNLLEETSMVMMALEGLERILQVGELEAKRTDSPNPYASLMASANIETLVSHKSATVAKRASRIWQQHFVTCAICLGPFSKHSNDTFFCAECKCNVCKNCDCTVFHLKYQESLWKEETEKETSEKQARQASKRSKRQKKRQRTKERKAALLRGQKAAPGSNGKGSKHNQQQKGQPQQDNSSSDEASSTKSGGGGGGGSRRRRHDADDSASENGSNGSNEEEEDGPGEEEEAATEEEVNVDVLDEMVNANDKLVSYLLETGSIMALAERLDLEDDSTWIVAEKDRTAIHA